MISKTGFQEMDFLETETFGTGKDIRDHPLQPLRFMVEDTEPRKR